MLEHPMITAHVRYDLRLDEPTTITTS